MGSLAQVLRDLPATSDPRLLVGPTGFDDSGVYELSADLALVQTVDFFPPLVDDPFQFGQIAAANSLSDVYAMGGTPLSCLSIVGFPDQELDIGVLVEILKGAHERVVAAGAVIAGGHSVRDAEVKFGLAVTGTIHPQRIVRNKGAQPGDLLVLTKPLGSGVMTTAAKKGKIEPAALAEAIAVMTDLNRAAAEAMATVPVHAATDITGFGLLGHAYEMASGSDVTLRIDSGAVPLLRGAYDLAAGGCVTRAAASNREHLSGALEVAGVDDVLVRVLADAQTSGGLLISVPADAVDTLCAALSAKGSACAAVVAEVIAPTDVRLILE